MVLERRMALIDLVPVAFVSCKRQLLRVTERHRLVVDRHHRLHFSRGVCQRAHRADYVVSHLD